MMKILRAISVMTALCLMPRLYAQSIISGDTVRDPSAAVLPSAQVSLRNLSTGSTQTAVTNGQDVYRFALLSPGSYAVSVGLQGFQAARQNHIAVVVGQTATAHFQLNLAAASQT